MSFSALVIQVLVSSPSDLPKDHRETVLRGIRLWNNGQARIYGIHFSPTDWEEGGTPAFGLYAQGVLNEQIVDDSDLGLVVFTDRLGSPTPDHPSGTAEEIQRLLDNGKDVAVLLNECPREPLKGQDALAQKTALTSYLDELQKKAFIGSYRSTEQLGEVLGQLLARVATKYRREADDALRANTPATGRALADIEPDPGQGVWPRIEVRESLETDNRGRVKTNRHWELVLESNLPFPATNVSYRYEDGHGQPADDFDYMGRADPIDVLPPSGSQRFPLAVTLGSPGSVMCVVDWTDRAGTQRETRATIRI